MGLKLQKVDLLRHGGKEFNEIVFDIQVWCTRHSSNFQQIQWPDRMEIYDSLESFHKTAHISESFDTMFNIFEGFDTVVNVLESFNTMANIFESFDTVANISESLLVQWLAF